MNNSNDWMALATQDEDDNLEISLSRDVAAALEKYNTQARLLAIPELLAHSPEFEEFVDDLHEQLGRAPIVVDVVKAIERLTSVLR